MSDALAQQVGDEPLKLLATFCAAVSDDLSLLAKLHGIELNETMLNVLKSISFPEQLGLSLSGDKSSAVIKHLAQEVKAWPGKNIPASLMDDLAADYAAIYLNKGYGVSPHESVWLDEDGLVMQEPMFQVREIYNRHGLEAANWRLLADDHLVNELEFIAYLMTRVAEGEDKDKVLQEVARFLDIHLLRWLGEFAERAAPRCETGFYAGLSLLTDLYCEELRDLLALILDQPRPTAEEIVELTKPKNKDIPLKPMQYVPGTSESW
jgi:TorA maturation chaperone TorD